MFKYICAGCFSCDTISTPIIMRSDSSGFLVQYFLTKETAAFSSDTTKKKLLAYAPLKLLVKVQTMDNGHVRLVSSQEWKVLNQDTLWK